MFVVWLLSQQSTRRQTPVWCHPGRLERNVKIRSENNTRDVSVRVRVKPPVFARVLTFCSRD